MSKSKIILASVGGVAAVAALALGYFIYDANSAKGEQLGELESAVSEASRLGKLPVYPGPAGIKAYEANSAAYSDWRSGARSLAAAGDRTLGTTTAPAFKAEMVDQARQLAELPGAVEGKIVKKDFPFGFREYIIDGQLPPSERDKSAEFARLQREWGDVVSVFRVLATNRVMEVTAIIVVTPNAEALEQQSAKPKKGKKAKKGGARKPAAAVAAVSELEPAVTHLTVEFLAQPFALAGILNDFAVSRRFTVVEDFRFARERDELGDAFAGNKTEKPVRNARKERLSRQKKLTPAEEQARLAAEIEAAKKAAILTDPQHASPLKVTMKLAVYDFRSQEAAAAAAGAEDEDSEADGDEEVE